MPATAGETRAWLSASYGVPHAPSTHYVIVADSADGFRLITCCDGTDEAGTLMAGALTAITGEPALAPESGCAINSKADLRAVLRDALNLCTDAAAWNRVAESAGLIRPSGTGSGPPVPTQ